jgi:hypothetical protein
MKNGFNTLPCGDCAHYGGHIKNSRTRALGYCFVHMMWRYFDEIVEPCENADPGAADQYPGWRGIKQPCDVCGRPVAVNANSPSECLCSAACVLIHLRNPA